VLYFITDTIYLFLYLDFPSRNKCQVAPIQQGKSHLNDRSGSKEQCSLDSASLTRIQPEQFSSCSATTTHNQQLQTWLMQLLMSLLPCECCGARFLHGNVGIGNKTAAAHAFVVFVNGTQN